MERKILHSDANAFYASVECVLNPDLKGKAVAVCGSQEERHGIVLAKSELAKRAGIKTGMTNWQAKRLCPELVIVPPRHDIYAKFSEALHEIYIRYTDYVEPFGLDECWLDVTRSSRAPYDIAEDIRQTVKGELGLTVSVGVSFNKVFAKLGSDMKKPDAVTVITRDNFKDTVWRLPCSDMIYCGRATTEKLKKLGVRTIGELARFPQDVLLKVFGKNGGKLWQNANGMDSDPVSRYDTCEQAKSVGHGVTCVADLVNAEEAGTVIVSLTQEIGQKLRKMRLRARGVQVTVRDKDLSFESWQAQLETPTQSAAVLAAAGSELLKKRYGWNKPIRALTVSAIRLESVDKPDQLSLFQTDDKRERVENTLDAIRSKFGDGAIRPATLLGESKLPPHGKNNL
ncbi:MAG: DNA polymerase IV [Clostridia bacterium]|nr:DNA polymerase IV [Clostridia bacterium]